MELVTSGVESHSVGKGGAEGGIVAAPGPQKSQTADMAIFPELPLQLRVLIRRG